MADAPEENDKEHPVQENASGKKKKKNDTPLENQASPLEKNVRPQRDAAKKAAEVPTTSQSIVYLFIFFHKRLLPPADEQSVVSAGMRDGGFLRQRCTTGKKERWET
jgi:hypothetical protein